MSKIIMYTTATCASCQMVKKWLTMKNQEWEEVRVDESPERGWTEVKTRTVRIRPESFRTSADESPAL